MKRIFVQTKIFSKKLDQKDVKELLEAIEDEILEDPQAGKVIAGTGGVRKLRIKDRSRAKGKRGGLRILYLDLPHREVTYLLCLYGKDESDDISFEQRKQILNLVRIVKGN